MLSALKSPPFLIAFAMALVLFSLSAEMRASEYLPQVEVLISSGPVKITEFMPNTESKEDKEWVKIINESDAEVSLDGWYLDDEDGGSSPQVISDVVIPSFEFVRIDFKGNVLNNSKGDKVRILDSGKEPVFSLSYKNTKKGYSTVLEEGRWVFMNPAEQEEGKSGEEEEETGEGNVSGGDGIGEEDEEENDEEEGEKELSFQDYSNLEISEFMPCPAEGYEWVEIFNGNNFEVNLESWKIDDIEGGSSPMVFTLAIGKGGYGVINLSSNKFNNSGDDKVRLLDPDESVKDEVSYNGCIKGYSYAKNNGVFSYTEKATPGDENEIVVPEEEEDEGNGDIGEEEGGGEENNSTEGDEEEESGNEESALGENDKEQYRTEKKEQENRASLVSGSVLSASAIRNLPKRFGVSKRDVKDPLDYGRFFPQRVVDDVFSQSDSESFGVKQIGGAVSVLLALLLLII